MTKHRVGVLVPGRYCSNPPAKQPHLYMSSTGKLEGFVVNVRYSSGTCSYILDIVSREYVLLDLELLDAARH